MSKIDGQMMQKFEDFRKNSPDNKCSQEQTRVLMTRAQTVDNVYTGSCSSSKGQGSKSLQRLMAQHPDCFTPESKADIQYFCTSGKIPNQTTQGCTIPPRVVVDETTSSSSSSSSGIGTSSSDSENVRRRAFGGVLNQPGSYASVAATQPYSGTTVLSGGMFSRPTPRNNAVDAPVVSARSVASTVVNNRMGNNAVVNGGSAANTVVSSGSPNINTGGSSSRPASNVDGRIGNGLGNVSVGGNGSPAAAPAATPNAGTTPPSRVSGNTGVVTANGTRVLDYHAVRNTWHCNWWPQQERLMAGGDPRYNLYAMNGPLHKLDMATGGSSRDYEYSKYRKSMGDGPNYSWWGHCNDAAQSACIFQEPKRSVTYKGQTFTPNDIQGLLVKASSSLITSTDFKGNRYNGPSDDPNEPAPDMFMQVMQEWSKDGLPFVFDIDPSGQVWNYPYDTVQIDESDKAPQGFAGNLSSEGSVKYYTIHASGTGYPDQVRNYQAYIQRNSSGAIVAQGWIKTPNTKNNPDFMWRPHPVGNIMDKSNWVLKNGASNPNIDMGAIYEIYAQSIA